MARQSFTPAAEQQCLRHAPKRQRARIGQRMVVGDMRLLQRAALEQCRVAQGEQRHRQVAHGCAVAAVGIGFRAFKDALQHVALDAAPAGGTDVHRFGFEPDRKGVRDRSKVPAFGADNRLAEVQGHFGIVGDLSGLETQPAAPAYILVRAELGLDLVYGEKLHRRAQGIAAGETEIGTERPVVQGAR